MHVYFMFVGQNPVPQKGCQCTDVSLESEEASFFGQQWVWIRTHHPISSPYNVSRSFTNLDILYLIYPIPVLHTVHVGTIE